MLQVNLVTGATSQHQKHNACVSLRLSLRRMPSSSGALLSLIVVPKPSRHRLQPSAWKTRGKRGSELVVSSTIQLWACPQVCPTAFKVAENEEGYVLRYYNMSQENVRVWKSTNHSWLVEAPISSSFRTIGTTRNSYRIHQKKKKFNFKRKHKRKEGRKVRTNCWLAPFCR